MADLSTEEGILRAAEEILRDRAVAAMAEQKITVVEPQTHEFGEWCVIELFGHRRVAGYVREVTIAGDGFLRLDVPGPDGSPERTQFYRPAAVYALHPVDEEVARQAAGKFRHDPVSRWELPAARPTLDEEEDDTVREDLGDDEHPF